MSEIGRDRNKVVSRIVVERVVVAKFVGGRAGRGVMLNIFMLYMCWVTYRGIEKEQKLW